MANPLAFGYLGYQEKHVPLPVNPARDFELGLAGQVAAFLRIWEDLNEQAQRAIAEGG